MSDFTAASRAKAIAFRKIWDLIGATVYTAAECDATQKKIHNLAQAGALTAEERDAAIASVTIRADKNVARQQTAKKLAAEPPIVVDKPTGAFALSASDFKNAWKDA